MLIQALIPARSGSKRIENKNVKMLGGRPLLLWSIETALRCKSINGRVTVSTNDLSYAQITLAAGADALMRPDALAGDSVGDYEVIRHFMEVCPCDIVVYLRPTSPFRDPVVVESAVTQLMVHGLPSLRSVEEMSESAWKCFRRDESGFLSPLVSGNDVTDRQNQAVERTYHPNGYVDIVRSENVKRGALWGDRRFGFLTAPVVELDTIEQWEFAEWKVARGWG